VAEQNEQTEQAEQTKIQTTFRPGHLSAAKNFVDEHGKPSKAVVEYLGRAGARVVLVGPDGALGDVIVPSVSAAEALVEAMADLEAAEWDAETVNATQISPEHRRKMGRSLLRQ
jgi:predicted CoA-binding protein